MKATIAALEVRFELLYLSSPIYSIERKIKGTLKNQITLLQQLYVYEGDEGESNDDAPLHNAKAMLRETSTYGVKDERQILRRVYLFISTVGQ